MVKKSEAQVIMELLQEIKAKGFNFNARTFTLVMGHFGTSGDAEEAARMVDYAKSSAVFTEELFSSFVSCSPRFVETSLMKARLSMLSKRVI